MRAITGCCLALALIAANVGLTRAQGLGPYALILVCSVNGDGGPAVLSSQPSQDLADLCEQPSEDDFFTCGVVGAVVKGMPCASALAELNGIGTAQSTEHAKTFLPSNFRFEIGDLPTPNTAAAGLISGLSAPRPQDRQADILYALKSVDDEASLVGCDFSGVPTLVDLQTSTADGGDADFGAESWVACADGLQARFDSGQGIVDAAPVHGWDPKRNMPVVGVANDDTGPSESVSDAANRIVHVYGVSGTGSNVEFADGGGDFVSMMICAHDAAAGAPVVAYFERSDAELAACDSGSPPSFCAAVADIDPGMPCATALAAVYRSDPGSVQHAVVHSGRPLLIIAEDVEGEAIATRMPRRPHTDILFMLGDEALVGCDFFARPDATLTTFEQVADGDVETVITLTDAAEAPSCADTLTLFLSDGTPLRAATAISQGVAHAVPDLFILDEPTAVGPGGDFEPEFGVQVVHRFAARYFVTTVTHRF